MSVCLSFKDVMSSFRVMAQNTRNDLLPETRNYIKDNIGSFKYADCLSLIYTYYINDFNMLLTCTFFYFIIILSFSFLSIHTESRITLLLGKVIKYLKRSYCT
jgi:hypothetical protein